MRRLLVPLLALIAALAAACGSGAGAGSDDPATLLRQSAAAVRDAHAVAFTLSARASTEGAAGDQGPYTVRLSGRSGRFGDEGRFDIRFEVGMRGLSVGGRALSADGKTLYVQMPLLLGPGWKSIDLTQLDERLQEDHTGRGQKEQERLVREALGLIHPARWLTDVQVTHPDGDDRIEASLDPRGMADDLLAVAVAMAEREGQAVPADELAQIRAEVEKALPKVEQALRRAHGSVVMDGATHLPSELRADLAVDLPAEHRGAGAPSAVSLALALRLRDWNEDFTVEAPANSEPLDLSRLGALGPGVMTAA